MACCFLCSPISSSSCRLFQHSLRPLLHPSPPLALVNNTTSLRLNLSSSTISYSFSDPVDSDLGVSYGGDDEQKDEQYGFEMEVRKVEGKKKKNRRLIRAKVRVDAPLEAVWATLTDYEGLAGFIPSLAECRLLEQSDHFARLYQVGEQDLALGLKFNAKGVIDCYEREMEVLPTAGGGRRREIEFKMIEGDFKVFEGKWSIDEVDDTSFDEGGQISVNQGFQTTLSYVVELEPKLWVPVRLLEGRICNEIKTNLVSIREEAQRIQRLENGVFPTTELLNCSNTVEKIV